MNAFRQLGLKDKDLQLGDFNSTKEYILEKLRNNWIVLFGDMDTIHTIEEVVYTPGTNKNEGFALVMGKLLPDDEVLTNIFLAKKTELLKLKLVEWGGISEEAYKKLLMINIVDKEGGVIWDYSLIMAEDKESIQKEYEEFAEFVVKDILQMEKYEIDKSKQNMGGEDNVC